MSDTKQGFFLTFEGIDGSGKSTQAAKVADLFEAQGYEVLRLREPGGNKISEAIRAVLLDPQNKGMGDMCEMLLMEASRAQLTETIIIPALERGAVIVCDRYYDSTTAYQAGARGIDGEVVARANQIGSLGCVPDLTLLYDIDVQAGYSRVVKNGKPDRMEDEGIQFMEKVRSSYLALGEREERVHLIDASGSIDEVFDKTLSCIKQYGKGFLNG